MIKNRFIVFIFIIYSLYYNLYLLLHFKSIHHICISLVIPSTNSSWHKCKNQIEKMICNSSKYPKEVIIVISNSSYNRKVEFYTYCKYRIYLFYRKNICFFDSDDIMSNNRIEIIHYIFDHYSNIDIILHMYTLNYTKINNNSYNNLNYIHNYFYLNSSFITYLYKKNIKSHKVQLWGCCHFLPIHYHISNGWITISKKLLLKEQFNEDISLQRAEDTEFNGRVIAKGYRAIILTMILGYYSKYSHQCNIIQ